MKTKSISIFFVMVMLATPAVAETVSAPPANTVVEPRPISAPSPPGSTAITEKQEDKYFAKDNPMLTDQEEAALTITKRLEDSAIKPVAGKNGAITYLFGQEQPSILCAVLQVSDVVLQAGEKVNNVELGDTARWTVEPAVSGSSAGEIQHLIIKPMDVGLSTSLVVTTNWRTYHFKLRSHRKAYMPQISFTYPDDAEKKWNAMKARALRDREDKTISETGEYLGNLSFDYDIEGNALWKPVRVYNDGHKTIIQMPSTMEQTEAPTLLVLRKEKIFSADETVMVNYRIQGDRYIVDSVFNRAILIAGVGKDQDHTTITWRKKQ